MPLRKAASYSKKHFTPYTRNSRRKSQAYIKTIPYSKIVKYNFGDQKAYRDGKHTYIIKLVARATVLVRDNALEACRMQLHKLMEEGAPGEYYLAVKVQPHHFLRNNKTSGIAGADRMSTGMSHSFGIIEGRAAIVPAGKDILFVSASTPKASKIARETLASLRSKIPGGTKVLFEDLTIKKQ